MSRGGPMCPPRGRHTGRPLLRPVFGIEPLEFRVGELAVDPPDRVTRRRHGLAPPAAPLAVVAPVGHTARQAPAGALEPRAQARMVDILTAAAGRGNGHRPQTYQILAIIRLVK